MKNSVNISTFLPVSFYWYLLILSVSFHGSVHVNMNTNPKILSFGHKMSILKSKMSKISHSDQKFSKFPKSPIKIPKFPKFPFSDQIWPEFPFSDLFIWSENGNLLTVITDIYWQWYFHFTDTDIFILLTANFFFLNITDTDISNLTHGCLLFPHLLDTNRPKYSE